MIKRAFDIVFSLTILILFSPVMLLTAAAIWFTMGRPIIFKQVRPGRNARPFTLYKFRSMKELYSQDGRELSYYERITPFGLFIRRASLDELPQLFNVLKGDMSVIGPRPLLPEYLEHYTPEQARRHRVKPGITGLAQVNGRNTTPFLKRLELDVEYVDRWSLWLDLKILVSTIPKVLGVSGVIEGGDVGKFQESDLNPEIVLKRGSDGSTQV